MAIRFEIPFTINGVVLYVLGSGTIPKLRKGSDGREKINHLSGKPTYSSGTLAIITNADGVEEIKKTITVNVVEPDMNGYLLGVTYQTLPTDPIVVQPYLSGNSIAYSITVKKLVPVSGAQK